MKLIKPQREYELEIYKFVPKEARSLILGRTDSGNMMAFLGREALSVYGRLWSLVVSYVSVGQEDMPKGLLELYLRSPALSSLPLFSLGCE